MKRFLAATSVAGVAAVYSVSVSAEPAQTSRENVLYAACYLFTSGDRSSGYVPVQKTTGWHMFNYFEFKVGERLLPDSGFVSIRCPTGKTAEEAEANRIASGYVKTVDVAWPKGFVPVADPWATKTVEDERLPSKAADGSAKVDAERTKEPEPKGPNPAEIAAKERAARAAEREAEFQRKQAAYEAELAEQKRKVAEYEQAKADLAKRKADQAAAAQAAQDAFRKQKEAHDAVVAQYEREVAAQKVLADFDNRNGLGKASTDTDANRCVTTAETRVDDTFKGNTSASVINGCGQPVDVRICLMTDGGWNCGVRWGVASQARASFSSFKATGQVFVDAKIAGSRRALASPN